MWSTAQRQKKIYRFDVNAGVKETVDQLAMATVFVGMVMC